MKPYQNNTNMYSLAYYSHADLRNLCIQVSNQGNKVVNTYDVLYTELLHVDFGKSNQYSLIRLMLITAYS